MNKSSSSKNFRRVLAQVEPSEFIGRETQLDRIVARAKPEKVQPNLLLLMEPAAGVSELLRQAYDEIFNRQNSVIPIYFAFTRNETTAVSAAIEFLITFLQQYIAFRENDPAIAQSTLTLQELLARAQANDRQWIKELVEEYKRRISGDDTELVRFCLLAPQQIPAERGRPFIMLDGAQLAQYLNGSVQLGKEVVSMLVRGGFNFVLAGLRRQILDATRKALGEAYPTYEFEHMLVTRLTPHESSQLVEQVARRHEVATSEHTRDLLVQQFDGSPFFINAFLQTARAKGKGLTSHFDCQRLYVEELFGGHLHSYFETLLEEISPEVNTRPQLIKLLWNVVSGKRQGQSFADWQELLSLDEDELKTMLGRLHMHEFVNWEAVNIHVATGPDVWTDYLKLRYALDVANKPRALVFGDTLTDLLKRQPTKQGAQVNLGKVVSRFNCQQVPEVLFDYAKFSRKYKGEEPEIIHSGLETDPKLELPQTVYVANCSSLQIQLPQTCEDKHCVIARTFKQRRYSDAQEVVWLVAYLHEKDAVAVNEADARRWCERLKAVGKDFQFGDSQIWLISNSGFTDEALELMEKEHKAFSSNKQQFKLLSDWLGTTGESGVDAESPEGDSGNPGAGNSKPSEFSLEMPFDDENELIAAGTLELLARRLPFRTEAINQIKLAVIEACINVFEHSFSPDRKISQRFRLESDRLVVTISSRGVVPTNLNGASSRSDTTEAAEARRGYGLILIRSLMDEVEFERVDDGTSLRMTKYLRETAS